MPLLSRSMTKLTGGSLLLQSPKPNLARQPRLPDGQHSSLQHVALKRRQLGGAGSVVVQVVQTVELIEVVDPNGVPVTVHTVFPPATTQLVDSVTGDVLEVIDTVANAAPLPLLPTDLPAASPDSVEIPLDITLDVPINVPDASIDVPAAVSDPVGAVSDVKDDVMDAIPDLSSATNLTTITNSSRDATSTSTPSSTSSFPTLAVPFNATIGWNVTLSTNNTRFRNRTSTSSSTTESTNGPVVLITDAPEVAVPAPAPPPQQPVPQIHRGGLPNPPPTSAVVGISVGSIAGAALIIFVIMALIRWKRRNAGKGMIGEGSTGNRGLLAGGNSVGEMKQQSLPTSLSGVLASLSRFKQQSAKPAQERGFQRISGRKLPSVWEHGGDGYTDPRQSVLSETSEHHYRDSQMVNAEGGVPTRLALGSPMRPVSGVLIMRPGPARTPITEDNPFSDPPTPSTIFRPDPLGRSLTGYDGSRVSSRFAEEV